MLKKILKILLYFFWYLPGIIFCFLVFRILNKTKISGKDNIPKKGGMLITVNHVSALDSWLIGHIFFPRMAFFPAKAELFRNPVLSPLLRGWGAFPVVRGRYNAGTMKRITELTKQNIVVIHPEGTRSRNGEIGKGSRGVGKIIYESNSLVIPVFIAGMENFLPVGAIFPTFFKSLSINIGKAIDFSRYKKLEPSIETYTKIVDDLMEEIKKLKGD